MKKVFLILALTFTTSLVFTSCRDDRTQTERAADDIEDAADDVGDEIEDIGDDME